MGSVVVGMHLSHRMAPAVVHTNGWLLERMSENCPTKPQLLGGAGRAVEIKLSHEAPDTGGGAGRTVEIKLSHEAPGTSGGW